VAGLARTLPARRAPGPAEEQAGGSGSGEQLATFHLHTLHFRLGFHTWKPPARKLPSPRGVTPGEGPFQPGKPREQGWESKAPSPHPFKPGVGYNSCNSQEQRLCQEGWFRLRALTLHLGASGFSPRPTAAFPGDVQGSASPPRELGEKPTRSSSARQRRGSAAREKRERPRPGESSAARAQHSAHRPTPNCSNPGDQPGRSLYSHGLAGAGHSPRKHPCTQTEEQRGNRGLAPNSRCPDLHKPQTHGLEPPGIVLLRGTRPSCSDSLSFVSWNRWKRKKQPLPPFPALALLWPTRIGCVSVHPHEVSTRGGAARSQEPSSDGTGKLEPARRPGAVPRDEGFGGTLSCLQPWPALAAARAELQAAREQRRVTAARSPNRCRAI